MKDFITKQQVAQNLKKFNFTTFDKDVQEKINHIHQKVFHQQLKQHKKKQNQQKGGRVAFPIEYFGSTTNHYSADVPKFTDISSTETHLRPPIPLNDPSGVLGTEGGVLSGMVGGKKSEFQIAQKTHEQSAREFLQEHHDDKKFKVPRKEFFTNSKQKFESLMDTVLTKASKYSKQNHLSAEIFDKVLSQKKFKAFKA